MNDNVNDKGITPLPRTPRRTSAFFALCLWTLLGVPVGGFLYAYVGTKLPWVWMSILTLFLLSFLNGHVMAAIMVHLGKWSKAQALIASFCIGVVTFYLVWVSWVWAMNDYWSLGLIFDPVRLCRIAGYMAHDEYRQMGARLISAWEWLLYWALEAMALILIPAVVIRGVFLETKKKSRCSS